MAMPRPTGEALWIARQVVPGMANQGKEKKVVEKDSRKGSLSRVEIMQTNNIKNKRKF